MTEQQAAKPIRVEVEGRLPPAGHWWCACCALRFMGAASTSPEFMAHAQEIAEAGIEQGHEYVKIAMPREIRIPDYPAFILRPAVTIAPSVYYPEMPMPVCWVHIQGMHPTGRTPPKNEQGQAISRLITGKSYKKKGTSDDHEK